MKIYISLDMEGVAGTFRWTQEGADRAYVRKYMAQQIEWIIEGIQNSCANDQVEEILLADSHGPGDNFMYELTAIDNRLHLVSGSPRPCYMMPVMDKSYDVVFLAGYHAGVGTQYGIMDHTFTGCFHRIEINGQPMSEALMNSAYAGYYGVPVALVIGDAALGEQLLADGAMPWIKYVTTKTGISRYAAKMRPLEVVKKDTIDAVKAVLACNVKKLPLYQFQAPVHLTIELANTAMTDIISMLPGIERLDGRTIELVSKDYKELYNARSAIGTLAGCYR